MELKIVKLPAYIVAKKMLYQVTYCKLNATKNFQRIVNH